MRKTWKLVALTTSLSLMACDTAEKKAAEAKALAEKSAADLKAAAEGKAAEAKALAEKQAAEAAAKANEAMASSKATLIKTIDDNLDAMTRKLDFLKQRAAKLPAAMKPKADAALATFDSAKATLTQLKTQLETAVDPATFSDLGNKATAAIGEATKALADAEATIMKK